jgi:glycosyltransferase involved in cell wall biosynthesis
VRILLITNKCPPDFDGGYELRAFQIAGALRARGHDVEIVTAKYRESFTGEKKDPEWVHRIFRYVGVTKATGIKRQLDRVLKHFESTTVAAENEPAMEAFLKAHHDPKPYDIVYAFGMLRVSFAVLRPVTQRGIPVLHHAGGTCLADHFHYWPKKYPGYAAAMRLFTRGWYGREHEIDRTHVAYVSDFLRDREMERGHSAPHRYVISRGIDFPLATDVDRPRTQPPTFLTAARIDAQKGIHNVIAACGILRKKRPELDWQYHLAGESLIPGYRAECEKLIADAGIGDRVKFLGKLNRADLLAAMRNATAFIFSSVYGEPFSSTIIESMACGTPLIGARDGSILEVATPGTDALVYEKNTPSELAAHMETVLTDPARARALAVAGLATVESRYTLDRILELTEKTLVGVIADRKKTRHA